MRLVNEYEIRTLYRSCLSKICSLSLESLAKRALLKRGRTLLNKTHSKLENKILKAVASLSWIGRNLSEASPAHMLQRKKKSLTFSWKKAKTQSIASVMVLSPTLAWLRLWWSSTVFLLFWTYQICTTTPHGTLFQENQWLLWPSSQSETWGSRLRSACTQF